MVLAYTPTACVSDVITCAVECLDIFVTFNWTGPAMERVKVQLEELLSTDHMKVLNQQALDALSSDGEVRFADWVAVGPSLYWSPSSAGGVPTLLIPTPPPHCSALAPLPTCTGGGVTPACQKMDLEMFVCTAEVAGEQGKLIVGCTQRDGGCTEAALS